MQEKNSVHRTLSTFSQDPRSHPPCLVTQAKDFSFLLKPTLLGYRELFPAGLLREEEPFGTERGEGRRKRNPVKKPGRFEAMSQKGLPTTFKDIVKEYPEVWEAHEQLTQACADAGPLNRKTRELIKVGIAVGAGLETATQRHAIMARENGASDAEIYQTVLMAMTTCGHPKTAAGWAWARSALEGTRKKGSRTTRRKK